MININSLQYNPTTNSIEFNYLVLPGGAVQSITVTHNGVTYGVPLTQQQLNSGVFNVPLTSLASAPPSPISDFKDLFFVNFAFSNETVITYTIGNLSSYEKCLAELVAKSELINCQLVNDNKCKTFIDKCRNNIYYLHTLLASIYRAIECDMQDTAVEILEKLKENLDCCDCCQKDCDYIYIKNNKYAPYHYFDNDFTCAPSTLLMNSGYPSGQQPFLQIPAGGIGQIFIKQGGQQVGTWNPLTNTWTIVECSESVTITINEETFQVIPGASFGLVIEQEGNPVGVYSSEDGTWTIPPCPESSVTFCNIEGLTIDLENGKDINICINQGGVTLADITWVETFQNASIIEGVINIPTFNTMLQSKTAQEIYDGLTPEQITALQALIC